jgi:hypothetical protein
MSALRPEADIWAGLQHVCFVPISDIREEWSSSLFGCKIQGTASGGYTSLEEKTHMERRNLILSLFAIGCFIATATLIPGLGTAQADKVKAAMADLKAKTEKLGTPKVEGKDLYFGTTKVDNSVVDAVAKEHGGVATLFVKSGDQYVRVATTVKKTMRASRPRKKPRSSSGTMKSQPQYAFQACPTLARRPHFSTARMTPPAISKAAAVVR